MKTKHWLGMAYVSTALVCGGLSAVAAPKKAPPAPPPAPLTEAGEILLANYAAMLTELQTEIIEALPAIDEQRKTAFVKAYQTESDALATALSATRAQAKAKDKEAAAKAYSDAREALASAQAEAQGPVEAILNQLDGFLASDKLDASLVKYIVLAQATPRGLAEFAQQGNEWEALVNKLLADDDLMKRMVEAEGANGGNYGQAMRIYTDIQKASPRAGEGILGRLALGVSLEHAVPIKQANPQTAINAPAIVDPVQRYLQFEKAYLNGELDPAFKDLSAWECRHVVNGDEPDETLAWGREMLRNYRPDHISTKDFRWRYVKAVKTDVKYGSQDQKNDLPSLQKYQNMINTGGVCGRRAFFGRFILRCFGIPTIARPQKGHATLVHWTPDGWVINLGAGWTWGWLHTGQQDLDFLAYTQARAAAEKFTRVQRAQWIGAVLGEPKTLGFHDEASGFWNGVALYRQRAIVEESKAVALAAVGQDIAEANVSKEADIVEDVVVTEADRGIITGPDGVITIPAVACRVTTTKPGKIVFMKSALGGLQMHYSRIGDPATFEYTFEAPAAGVYELVARVVTVSPDQRLLVTPNDANETVDITAPYTIGMWEQTPPARLPLVKGRNVLRFTRAEPVKGMTIKDFTLTPVK
ncbi:MAG: hypothetical protein RRC34_01430 [Lentisphaeria bacterium]|nr:hypothetical protein [Lentisphaeria bacterium]